MRIVSVNAWGGARYDDLAAWLPTTGADVVCLQEVTRTPDLDGWTRFEDDARVLPQRADLMADVEAALPGHDGWFTVSDSGPVTDDAGAVHRQHFGLGMFTSPTTLVVGVRAAYVHGSYTDHGDAWGPRQGSSRACSSYQRSTGSCSRLVGKRLIARTLCPVWHRHLRPGAD